MDPDGAPGVLGQTPRGSDSRLGSTGMGVTVLLNFFPMSFLNTFTLP